MKDGSQEGYVSYLNGFDKIFINELTVACVKVIHGSCMDKFTLDERFARFASDRNRIQKCPVLESMYELTELLVTD